MSALVDSDVCPRPMTKGSGAEEAVPALLAARDDQLERDGEQHLLARLQAEAAAAATTKAVAEAVATAAPSCAVCFEPYGGVVVPRMLGCGHTFCEECLSKMLRCGMPTMSYNKCIVSMQNDACTM